MPPPPPRQGRPGQSRGSTKAGVTGRRRRSTKPTQGEPRRPAESKTLKSCPALEAGHPGGAGTRHHAHVDARSKSSAARAEGTPTKSCRRAAGRTCAQNGRAPIPAVPTRSQQQFPRVWVRRGRSEVGPALPSESPRKAAGPQQGWLQIWPCSLGGSPAGLGLAGEGAREGTQPGGLWEALSVTPRDRPLKETHEKAKDRPRIGLCFGSD